MHRPPPRASLRHPFASALRYYVNSPGNPRPKRPTARHIDAPLLEQLVYLCKVTARHSAKGSLYCFPSQTYLGEQVGRCRETVNRHVRELVERGLITSTQRRKQGGRWRSCLYRVASWVLEAIRHGNAALPSPTLRCDVKRTHSGYLSKEAAASPPSTTPMPSWAAAWVVRCQAFVRV